MTGYRETLTNVSIKAINLSHETVYMYMLLNSNGLRDGIVPLIGPELSIIGTNHRRARKKRLLCIASHHHIMRTTNCV